MLPLLGGSHAGGAVTLPETFDDEFVGVNTEWSVWTNIGGSTVDFDTTTPGTVHMQHATWITRPRIPAFPFTVEAYCSYLLYDNINTQTANASLALGFPPTSIADGGFWGLEWDVDTLGRIGIYDGKFVPVASTPSHFGSIIDNQLGLVNQIPHKQRMVCHSATNIDLQYTKDVVSASPTWSTYITGVNPGITLNTVYLASFGCTTEWEYVRFY